MNSSKNKYADFLRITGLSITLFLLATPLWAHAVIGELEKMSATDAALLYLVPGYKHILP